MLEYLKSLENKSDGYSIKITTASCAMDCNIKCFDIHGIVVEYTKCKMNYTRLFPWSSILMIDILEE